MSAGHALVAIGRHWQRSSGSLRALFRVEYRDRKWKNAKYDVQASRKAKLIALAGGRIELPAESAALLRPGDHAT